MCHNTMVMTVVEGFVKKGLMFTAFDVTKFIRASGTSIRHSTVNSAVKEMYRDGEIEDYERDITDVGAAVSPFVYYHPNSDLDDYESDWLENNPDQKGYSTTNTSNASTSSAGIVQPSASSLGTKPSVPAPVKTTVVKPTVVKPTVPVTPTLPKGVHATDKEGRLYIAPIVTKSAGLHPKQVVWVVTDSSKLVITANSAAKGSWPYSVNKDGRIRICRSVLSKIPSAIGYKVSAGTGNIEIAPA